jgi:molybdopterin/thiamine biosynthesis adenylyltransferase
MMRDKAYDEDRFSRQLGIIGSEGQEALGEATVTVVGLGGLGSPVSIYLAAAGVGKLVLVDPDEVAVSNLNRQIIHGEGNLGDPKTISAGESLNDLNSTVEVKGLDLELRQDNLDELPESDLVVGALDNFRARYLLNEYAVNEGVPFVHGAVEGFRGQLATIVPGETACLRCIFPEEPPEEDDLQVMGPAAGVTGALMAGEAIKYFTGSGTLAAGELVLLDLAENDFDKIEVSRSEGCPTCGSI